MPIYAYKCTSCGHAKDVLQKMSDTPLSVCPACGQASFQKQLTAAGFQLKGSGWYVTDFRNGNTGATPAAAKTEGEGEGGSASPAKPTEGAGSSVAATPSGAAAAAPAASEAAAPAAAPASSPPASSSTS